MWRLNMLKKEAWKSIVAFSPIRCVFFPIVRSSFLPPDARADDKERGALPNLRAAAGEKAAGFPKRGADVWEVVFVVCGRTGGMSGTCPARLAVQPQ